LVAKNPHFVYRNFRRFSTKTRRILWGCTMPTIECEGLQVELDDEGYLADFETWNEQIACALADREGVSQECPLTQERMEILNFMREYYKKFDSFPILRAVCKKHTPVERLYV